MAVGPLFAGLLLLAWLFLGISGWTAVTFLYRPNASFLALAAALAAALLGGVLPALAGRRDAIGLVAGLILALLGSTTATWQTMSRTAGRPRPDDEECQRR